MELEASMYVDSSILWFVPIRGAGVVGGFSYVGFLLLGYLLLFTCRCGLPSKKGASSLVLNAFDVGFLAFCLKKKE